MSPRTVHIIFRPGRRFPTGRRRQNVASSRYFAAKRSGARRSNRFPSACPGVSDFSLRRGIVPKNVSELYYNRCYSSRVTASVPGRVFRRTNTFAQLFFWIRREIPLIFTLLSALLLRLLRVCFLLRFQFIRCFQLVQCSPDFPSVHRIINCF